MSEQNTIQDVSVAQIMRRDPKTITGEETVRIAVVKMRVNGIRHLVVVSPDGGVFGLISQRDIFRFLAEVGHRSAEVRSVMTAPVISANPEMSVAEAAQLMRKERIGCLPIVSATRKLVGIITRSDVLDFVSS